MTSIPSLATVFNMSGLIAFCAGIVATRGYYWLKDLWADHTHPEQPHHVHRLKTIILAWSVLGVSMLYIVGQTHQASTLTANNAADVRGLSTQTRSCQKAIIASLKTRADLVDESDALTEQLRNQLILGNKELDSWINQLLNPPANIAALPINALERQEYGLNITTAYFAHSDAIQKQIADLQVQVRANHEERAKYPLGSPQC